MKDFMLSMGRKIGGIKEDENDEESEGSEQIPKQRQPLMNLIFQKLNCRQFLLSNVLRNSMQQEGDKSTRFLK